MRAIIAALPVALFLVVGCAAEAPEPETSGTTEGLTQHGSRCAISRDQMLGSVSGARRRAIARGLQWLDARVPYSQGRFVGGYRTDCSGFVSMCWDLGQSTNTGAMSGGAFIVPLRGYDDLVPADALLKNGHVTMFVGWNDRAHTSACLLEEGNQATGTQMRAATLSSLRAQGYRPVRAQKLANDVGGSGPGPVEQDDVPQDEPMQPSVPDDPGVPGVPGPSDTGDSSCWSNTLGTSVPESACVYSRFDQAEEQCHEGRWYRGVSGGEGPFGPCVNGI